MRKTFLKVSLLAVLGLGMSASFTSCKDYDPEIDNLQSQIDQLKSKVTEIENLVKGGSVITGVTQAADGGVTFTMSDGKTVTIPAGKAGKDADVWTIVKNAEGAYYWAKNGEITEFPAQGPAGENGVAEPGICYVPNEDGFFYEYNPATGESKKTDIEWRSKGGNLNAVATEDKVILSGFLDENGEEGQVTIWRSMFVKSLVVKPELYLDGIEATRYGVINQQTIKTNYAQNATPVATKDSEDGATLKKGAPVSYSLNAKQNGDKIMYYENEIATLAYGLNPSNAVTEGMKWNLLFDNIEVVNRNRSSFLDGEVLGTEKDGNGNIIVTYQLNNTEYLAPYDYESGENWDNDDNWTMMALQAANMATDSALAVSNNVFIAKERIGLVHLAVNNNVAGAFNTWKQTWNTAALATAEKENTVFTANPAYTSVLETPAEVLEVAYNQTYDLASHIKIETLTWTPMIDGDAATQKENEQLNWYKNEAAKSGLMTLADAAKKFNLTANYELVPYTIKPNQTSEDQFAQINKETGVVTPCWVNTNGESIAIPGTTQGRSAIGRKPMVYVTLSGADGNIVLAGFVKLIYTEAAKVLPGITLAEKRIPYICDYTVSSTWEQITGAVYEQIGVTPEEFSNYFKAICADGSEYDPKTSTSPIQVYVEVNGEMKTMGQQSFKAETGKDLKLAYNLGTFEWDENENGTHTQELSLNITNTDYQCWYPTYNSNGVHNGYSVTTDAVSKKLYAKFFNKTNNTTVYIGFDVTVIGAPAADYTGKLVSQWSTDLEVAPINPAVPGQTENKNVQALTGYNFASAMSMNFTSVWNGGQPTLINYAAEYNFTNDKAPYLLTQRPAQYSFAAAQDTVTGVSGAQYKILRKKLYNGTTNLGDNTQAIYAAKINPDNGKADEDNAQPIAVITSSKEVIGIAARAEVLNAGSTTDAYRWEVISMLPYYNESTNSHAPYTPSYGKTIGSTGWKYGQFACDIVNAKAFDKNAPAITFNVEMRVNYTQLTDENKAAIAEADQCTLVIPGKYDLMVGVGRPVALNKANEGELQDAVDGYVLASKLFSMVDWQGHLLWNTSRNGTVTANTFNNTNLAHYWLSQDKYTVEEWPTNVTYNDKDNTPVKGAAIVIDLKNALVGETPDGKKLGKFHEVYVDKELTLECTTSGIVNDNIASFADVELLDDITIEWENNGSTVTKNIYVFVPIYINYVWGQDIFLGYATITVKPTLSE